MNAITEERPAEFLNLIDVTRYVKPGSGKWVLMADLDYYSAILKRVITVPKGFITDFASVPRWPVVFLFTGDTSDEAATVHDYLYSSGIVSRKVADSILAEASAAMGEPGWRRFAMYAAVRIGGASHYASSTVSIAPAEDLYNG